MSDSRREITFDARSLSVDGTRQLLISGEIHYSRIPRAEWERVLDRTKEAGVNCIASYIFWGVHEPRRGHFDFSGRADLAAFLRLCRERDLWNILRPGPYCCAEWNFGGFPSWLRDVPGIVTRTWNQPYLECVANYFRVLAAEMRPHLATQGGNVILVQVENEYNNIAKRYGADGDKYLAWMVEYVKSLGIDVPTITCEGGAAGAIEAVNGFRVHASAAKLRQSHPDIPLLWTENWPGWYDTWGYEHHLRQATEIGYEILRFIAVGGSGFNYYMWHGGTNFGRSTMYLQATSYDFDAPVNEWGEPTDKSRLLQKLHRALLAQKDVLLTGERREESSAENRDVFTVSWQLGENKVLISVNGSAAETTMALLGLPARSQPAASACLWTRQNGEWKTLWKSWPQAGTARPAAPWRPVAAKAPWLSFTEPGVESRRDAISSPDPVEQLLLTKDSSDYCWYATELVAPKAGPAQLRISRGGDFLYVFVNGKLAARTEGRLPEVRGPTVGPEVAPVILANQLEKEITESGKNGYEHLFTVPLQRGSNRIEILACSLGLIKGDWQLALSMNFERKGIWDAVFLNGKRLRNWRHYPRLVGERLGVPEGAADELGLVKWKPSARPAPLTWYLKRFALTPRELGDEFVWAFDAEGLEKGFVWINGRGIGRFWQTPAEGAGVDAPWQTPIVTVTGNGGPTQRFYPIPASWLRRENRLVVLSESGAKPAAGSLVRRLYVRK